MMAKEMKEVIEYIHYTESEMFNKIIKRCYDSYNYGFYVYDRYILDKDELSFVDNHEKDFIEIENFMDIVYEDYDYNKKHNILSAEDFEKMYFNEVDEAQAFLDKIFNELYPTPVIEKPKDPQWESAKRISEFAIQSAMRSHEDIKYLKALESEHVKKFGSINDRMAQRFKDFFSNY